MDQASDILFIWDLWCIGHSDYKIDSHNKTLLQSSVIRPIKEISDESIAEMELKHYSYVYAF